MIAGVLYSDLEHLMDQKQGHGDRWTITYEVIDWLRDNNITVIEKQFVCTDRRKIFGLLFDSNEGFIAFKLRWL